MKKDKNNVIWEDRQHWMWFPFSFTTFTLTADRLYQQHGLFSTHYDETMLYKIIDICLKRSLLQKLFGTGTIVLSTRADSQPHIYMKNIKHPMETKDLLSKAIEEERVRKNVIGKEFYSGQPVHGGPHDPHAPEFDQHDFQDADDFQDDMEDET